MVIIWDKQPEPNYAPIVIEEPVEELPLDEEEELVEEVKTASGFNLPIKASEARAVHCPLEGPFLMGICHVPILQPSIFIFWG
jgi:hypothetical protein